MVPLRHGRAANGRSLSGLVQTGAITVFSDVTQERTPHMTSARRVSTIAAGLAATALLATAGTGVAAKATTVNVTMASPTEFTMKPSVTSVKAGKVTFKVTNKGKMTHEMVVIKTNAAPGKIPVKNGVASEAGAVGETGDVAAGKTKTFTVTLKKGKYQLICNIPGHSPLFLLLPPSISNPPPPFLGFFLGCSPFFFPPPGGARGGGGPPRLRRPPGPYPWCG